MVNYNLGKIYKIVCNTTGLVYIGSTCEPTLARRLVGHRGKYSLYLKGKCEYTTSYKTLENNNFEIVLIENYPCANKDELHKQERMNIENTECVNKQFPGRTKEEYRVLNADIISEQNKLYKANNKQNIKDQRTIYLANNKDKINERRNELRKEKKLLKNI